ncbi:DUF547 domain-containing protein [Flavobacteriales bacterium 33_180_T64]|nr:DUF547 domain-containing protein [Flavobacteriales bacterium 33_180_T64]
MNKFILIVLLFSVSILNAQDLNSFFEKTDGFLNTYVDNGKVAYSEIHKNQSDLDEILTMAKSISVKKSDAKIYQAFWINAYNISVIKGIIDNYPMKSPLDKAGFFDKTKHNIAGESIALNTIENKKLRAQFGDARFHFVLVCGAVGCPPLINKAYLPNTLEAQLQKQTEVALNNPNFIKIKKNKIELSEIFKWYKEDFVKTGSEIDYINSFRTKKIASKSKVSYYTYNWTINKQ